MLVRFYATLLEEDADPTWKNAEPLMFQTLARRIADNLEFRYVITSYQRAFRLTQAFPALLYGWRDRGLRNGDLPFPLARLLLSGSDLIRFCRSEIRNTSGRCLKDIRTASNKCSSVEEFGRLVNLPTLPGVVAWKKLATGGDPSSFPSHLGYSDAVRRGATVN